MKRRIRYLNKRRTKSSLLEIMTSRMRIMTIKREKMRRCSNLQKIRKRKVRMMKTKRMMNKRLTGMRRRSIVTLTLLRT